MSPCFSTLGCPDLSFAQAADLARAHGVGAIELRALGGSIDLPSALREEFGAPAAFAAAVRDARLVVPVLGTSFRLLDHVDADRARLLAYLPWSEALGGCLLRVFDGGARLGSDELAHAAEALDWWEGEARARGWRSRWIVETHDTLLRRDALRRFRETFPGLELLWDVHHTWAKGGEPVVETWREIAGAVAHVHLRDSVARPEGGRSAVPPGEGRLPFVELRRELERFGYEGALCLEWESYWDPGLPPIERALSAMRSAGWW